MYTYNTAFRRIILIPATGAKMALAAVLNWSAKTLWLKVYYYWASESEMVRHVPNGPMVQKLAVLALAAGFKIFSQNGRG